MYISYINEILKRKVLEKLSSEELFVNLLDKELDDDILKIRGEVVDYMEAILNKFNEDDYLRLLAFKREDYLRIEKLKNKEAHEEGLEEGLAKGKQNGMLEDAKSKVMQLFAINYPSEDTSFLDNLTLKQYDQLFIAIAKKEPINNLKSMIKQD